MIVYDVKCGYIAVLKDGSKMLFPTEQEAVEYLRKEDEDSD